MHRYLPSSIYISCLPFLLTHISRLSCVKRTLFPILGTLSGLTCYHCGNHPLVSLRSTVQLIHPHLKGGGLSHGRPTRSPPARSSPGKGKPAANVLAARRLAGARARASFRRTARAQGHGASGSGARLSDALPEPGRGSQRRASPYEAPVTHAALRAESQRFGARSRPADGPTSPPSPPAQNRSLCDTLAVASKGLCPVSHSAMFCALPALEWPSKLGPGGESAGKPPWSRKSHANLGRLACLLRAARASFRHTARREAARSSPLRSARSSPNAGSMPPSEQAAVARLAKGEGGLPRGGEGIAISDGFSSENGQKGLAPDSAALFDLPSPTQLRKTEKKRNFLLHSIVSGCYARHRYKQKPPLDLRHRSPGPTKNRRKRKAGFPWPNLKPLCCHSEPLAS